jgi:hypothetical protein
MHPPPYTFLNASHAGLQGVFRHCVPYPPLPVATSFCTSSSQCQRIVTTIAQSAQPVHPVLRHRTPRLLQSCPTVSSFELLTPFHLHLR